MRSSLGIFVSNVTVDVGKDLLCRREKAKKRAKLIARKNAPWLEANACNTEIPTRKIRGAAPISVACHLSAVNDKAVVR